LYKAITRTDADFKAMPPKENDQLTAAEVQAVKAWIDGGAPWPATERIAAIVHTAKPAGVRVQTSGGLSPRWTNRTYQPQDRWAYQTLRKPAVPPTTATNPIDAFLAERMKALEITPAPPADRRTLLRRVTFDLTGLPPTPTEIDAFLRDPESDEQAFAKVLD